MVGTNTSVPGPDPLLVNAAVERNTRIAARYDELMAEGKHGHYETLFRVVREEIEGACPRSQVAIERNACLRQRNAQVAAENSALRRILADARYFARRWPDPKAIADLIDERVEKLDATAIASGIEARQGRDAAGGSTAKPREPGPEGETPK